MLLVQEHLIKLGGVKLSGQMKSIDISEVATIENIEDDKGKTKANQPTGYEAAKVSIEFILEESKSMTQVEQIYAMQRLFKPYGQKKAKLLKVINEDCAARGISKVYFEKLSTKNQIPESKRTAMLELLAPTIAGIRLKPSKQVKAIQKKMKKDFGKSKKKRGRSPSSKKRDMGASKKNAIKLVSIGLHAGRM